MSKFIPHQFDKLKSELMQLSGIKQIVPSHCKYLSAEIYNKTRMQVSETTLKRIFGFACSKFNPSVFTINAIAQYCGYADWSHFLKCHDTVKTFHNGSCTNDALSVKTTKTAS